MREIIIDLNGYPAKEAPDVVRKALRQAFEIGASSLTIFHGRTPVEVWGDDNYDAHPILGLEIRRTLRDPKLWKTYIAKDEDGLPANHYRQRDGSSRITLKHNPKPTRTSLDDDLFRFVGRRREIKRRSN